MHLIQFVTSINLLHVSEPGSHLQRVFRIKEVQAQYPNLGMHSPQWND